MELTWCNMNRTCTISSVWSKNQIECMKPSSLEPWFLECKKAKAQALVLVICWHYSGFEET